MTHVVHRDVAHGRHIKLHDSFTCVMGLLASVSHVQNGAANLSPSSYRSLSAKELVPTGLILKSSLKHTVTYCNKLHIYIYTHMYVYMYICIYTHTHMYIYICTSKIMAMNLPHRTYDCVIKGGRHIYR